MTSQTMSVSEPLYEKKKQGPSYVARIGITGAPPWSQAWGWGSDNGHLVGHHLLHTGHLLYKTDTTFKKNLHLLAMLRLSKIAVLSAVTTVMCVHF